MRTPSSSPQRLLVPYRIRAAHWTFLASTLLGAAPLSAQAAQQVGVTGHVAPRCWILPPAGAEALIASDTHSRRPVAARCNHAATPLSMQVRRAAAEAPAPVAQTDNMVNRAPIEITLSPTL